MNRLAVPIGLKLSSVASISSQDTRAATTPAPRAQKRPRRIAEFRRAS